MVNKGDVNSLRNSVSIIERAVDDMDRMFTTSEREDVVIPKKAYKQEQQRLFRGLYLLWMKAEEMAQTSGEYQKGRSDAKVDLPMPPLPRTSQTVNVPEDPDK